MNPAQLSGSLAGLPRLRFDAMQAADIDEVMTIERSVYPHPWTPGNFLDSLSSGYEAWLAREADQRLAGYFLAMPAVDEMHLLNISVRADLQGCGLGRLMLDRVAELAVAQGIGSVLLEVRPSNLRALAIYERFGFARIGLRKAYYPVTANGREDAIVMRLPL